MRAARLTVRGVLGLTALVIAACGRGPATTPAAGAPPAGTAPATATGAPATQPASGAAAAPGASTANPATGTAAAPAPQPDPYGLPADVSPVVAGHRQIVVLVEAGGALAADQQRR